MQRKTHRYTPKEIEFIRQNVDGISNEELTKRFDKKFNTNLSKSSIRYIKSKHGLHSHYYPNGFSSEKQPLSDKHRYTPEEIEFLRQNANGKYNQEITDMFNKRFNTNLSKNKITSINKKYGIKTNVKFDFRQNMYRNAYKNMREVGHVRYNGFRRYFEIKVAMPSVWRPKHHVLYEKYHNVKLSPDDKIIFADGDNTNFDRTNLQKV